MQLPWHAVAMATDCHVCSCPDTSKLADIEDLCTLKYTRTGNLFHQNSQLVKESYAHLFSPPTNLFSDLFDLINTSKASSSKTNWTRDACIPEHAFHTHIQHIGCA